MTKPLYIFAGGGTGGHLYPGLAVAEELLRVQADAKIVFACSDRAIDRRILNGLPYAIVPQPVRPLPSSPGKVLPFLLAWRRSARLAREMIRDLRPRAVLGLGGFAAGPMVQRAHRAGVRSAMLNPDAVPGKANLWLARQADAIFTQFDSTRDSFPARYRDKVRAPGCPIRSWLIGASRDEAVKRFDLDAGRRTLLVLGGSLGAESINDAFRALLPAMVELSAGWQVLHVAGPGKTNQDSQSGGVLVRTLEYCHRMDLAYAIADVALCRGGAGMVAELAATSTPSVILPYPYHADMHQRHNAAELVTAGSAVICDDAKDASVNAHRLSESLLPLLRDAGVLERMRKSAGGLGKPAAARAIAEWLVGSVGG